MKKTYRHILARALAAVPLACSVLLSSCYTDEYDGCPTDGQQPVAVRLNISAGEPGDLNGTRAAGDLVEGGDGEFMHTLYIYIVDSSGRLVKKFENPLEGSALASTGDVNHGRQESSHLNQEHTPFSHLPTSTNIKDGLTMKTPN